MIFVKSMERAETVSENVSSRLEEFRFRTKLSNLGGIESGMSLCAI